MKDNINIINQNPRIKTPEEMKANLEKINNSFNQYLKSLIKDFDENPESLKDSVKYSSDLIDDFKQFYNEYNFLSEEVLIKPNQSNMNQNQQNQSNRNRIYIDYLSVKAMEKNINDYNNKLKKTNDENEIKINKIFEDLRKLTPVKPNK